MFGISGSHAYQITDAVGGCRRRSTSAASARWRAASTIPPSPSASSGLCSACRQTPTWQFRRRAVQQITTGGGNFPAGGVSSVCYLDGYYIFTSFDGR
jgi:hypothetical protein